MTSLTLQSNRVNLNKELEDRGFKQTQYRKLTMPGRLLYKRGTVQVLTDSSSHPWITVQKVGARSAIDWFVDFPVKVSLDSIFAFIEAEQ